jgi:hypothetical protein
MGWPVVIVPALAGIEKFRSVAEFPVRTDSLDSETDIAQHLLRGLAEPALASSKLRPQRFVEESDPRRQHQ